MMKPLAAALALFAFACSETEVRPPTGAAGALAWRRLTMQDAAGRIPPDAEMEAQRQMAALRTEGAAGGLNSAYWTDVGPGNIGGRVRAIAIHPTNPNTIFCGGVAGGIWRSKDAGANWSRVDDRLENLAITSIVFTPGDPKTMYASTGEGFGNLDAVRGAGIFKSTDTGATWTRIPATNSHWFQYVNRLSMSSTGVLLAATSTGIWRTTNGGATWHLRHNTASQYVAFHPNKPNIVIAHVNAVANGVYSTDGGLTFKDCVGLKTGGLPRVEFAWHRGYSGSGNGAVYALKELGSTLYRSTDGGANFVLVSTNSFFGTQGWYDNVLWVDPTDTDAKTSNDVVIAGGIDLHRSTDGGATFTKISQWYSWPNSAHGDHHRIIEHPGFDGTSNKTVYFGNDGGVWRTDDVYAVTTLNGWVNLNTSLGITQFYSGSTHAGSGIVIGGTQDNGTLRRDSATKYNGWLRFMGGDGGFTASDPTDSNYHFAEFQYGELRRSTNGALSASLVRDFCLEKPNFIAPFILDPNDPNTLLFGARRLFRSTDAKAVGKPSFVHIKGSHGVAVSAIAVAKGNSNKIWVGHNLGNVYSTSNGTAASPNWTQRDNGLTPLPDRYVTRIVVDELDHSHVYVTFGGYEQSNIWETKNSGGKWSALSGLPSAPVRDLEIHRTKRNWLYAATEVGLLVSMNSGVSWTSAATPATVSIDEMFWGANDTLYLATHGRGMFRQKVTFIFDIGIYTGFDHGKGSKVLNLGNNAPPASMHHAGSSTNGPWAVPGRFGRAMLQGSSNATASHYNYCDTGWTGPLEGDFTLHFWMKERAAPGRSESYVFGGLGGFHCLTNGPAGTSLAVRGWNGLGSEIRLPTVGNDLQTRARAPDGVNVTLTVDSAAKSAQWYLDGVAHGGPIRVTGGANVPSSRTTFKIGKHSSDTLSCVYDLDEFRLVNRVASAAEIRAWIQGPKTLYYKFDRGVGDVAVNYGSGTGSGTLHHKGSATNGPWAFPGRFGAARLHGSSNTTATHVNYCDTGFRGPVAGDFTVHWWMQERIDPGTTSSYLWGGLGNFHCSTNGIAGSSLAVSGWGGEDLVLPTLGKSLQDRARSRGGVWVGLSVDTMAREAQWYVDGVPHGGAVPVSGGADVPTSPRSFMIGKHASDATSSAYDIDEFRLVNYVAPPTTIRAWSNAPTAASGGFGKPCGITLGSLGGQPVVGNPLYSYTIAVDPPATTYCVLVFGFTPAPGFDMGIVFPRLAGCGWYTALHIAVGITIPGTGRVEVPVPIPNDPALASLHLDTQTFGFSLPTLSRVSQSNALSHVIELR